MKRPWMKFYPADWQADQALRSVGLAARCLWLECMCIMHRAEPYGHLVVNGRPVTDTQLAILAGAPPDEVPALMAELQTAGVFSRNRAGVIYSRRMTRDEKRSKDGETSKKTGAKVPGSRRAQRVEKTADKPATYRVDSKVAEQPPSPQMPDTREEKSSLSGAKKEPSRKQVPEDWLPTDAGRAFARERGPWTEARIECEVEHFRSHHRKKADRFADWDAAWRTWVLQGAKYDAARSPQASPQPQQTDPIEQWRGRIDGWRLRRVWPVEMWGPPPGQPGCRAPPKLLAELSATNSGTLEPSNV